MATIRRRGSKWEAQIRRKGHRTISRSFETKTDAKTWARQIEVGLEIGSLELPGRSKIEIKLDNLVERYLAEVTKDTPDKLSHGVEVGASSKGTEDIGEGTVPALLQRLFGDNYPHPVGRGQKVEVFRLVQVVDFSGLDCHLGLVETRSQKCVGFRAYNRLGLNGYFVPKDDLAHIAAGCR